MVTTIYIPVIENMSTTFFSDSDSESEPDVYPYAARRRWRVMREQRERKKPERYVDPEFNKLMMDDIPDDEKKAALEDTDFSDSDDEDLPDIKQVDDDFDIGEVAESESESEDEADADSEDDSEADSEDDSEDEAEDGYITPENIITSKRVRKKPDRYIDADYATLVLEDIPENEMAAALENEDFSDQENANEESDDEFVPGTSEEEDDDTSDEEATDTVSTHVLAVRIQALFRGWSLRTWNKQMMKWDAETTGWLPNDLWEAEYGPNGKYPVRKPKK